MKTQNKLIIVGNVQYNSDFNEVLIVVLVMVMMRMMMMMVIVMPMVVVMRLTTAVAMQGLIGETYNCRGSSVVTPRIWTLEPSMQYNIGHSTIL